MKQLNVYIIIIFFQIFLFACKKMEHENDKIKLLCIRDTNGLYIRIQNNSQENIYVPSDYIGTFNIDCDTIHLEAIDKPRYNLNRYYKYSKIFPFSIYTAKRIEGQNPDTVIEIVNPTYCYNAFRVRPFIKIKPNSIYFQPVLFYVPQYSNFVTVVYYKRTFANWLERDSNDYMLHDWIKFDSIYAKYLTTKIFNRYY